MKEADFSFPSFMADCCHPAAAATYLDELAKSSVRDALGLTAQELEKARAELATLHEERAALLDDIERLRVHKLESMLVFLPIVFRNFWTEVRPDEVALMAGTLQLPKVPSPYREPSPETVQFMKAKLKEMREVDRDHVLGFCRCLRHRLQVRSEMREFF